MNEKEKQKLIIDLAECLVKAVNQLNDLGRQLANDPLTRDCCACISQFACGDEGMESCHFCWTFFNEAKYLIEKVKEMKKSEDRIMKNDKTILVPLTPAIRSAFNDKLSEKISELQNCEQNVFINDYMSAYNALYGLMQALPDGYPLPVEKK